MYEALCDAILIDSKKDYIIRKHPQNPYFNIWERKQGMNIPINILSSVVNLLVVTSHELIDEEEKDSYILVRFNKYSLSDARQFIIDSMSSLGFTYYLADEMEILVKDNVTIMLCNKKDLPNAEKQLEIIL